MRQGSYGHERHRTHVMAASMRYRGRLAFSIGSSSGRGVGKSCGFKMGSGIHIRTEQDDRTGSIDKDANDAMTAYIGVDDDRRTAVKMGGNNGSGTGFLLRKLGVVVHVTGGFFKER